MQSPTHLSWQGRDTPLHSGDVAKSMLQIPAFSMTRKGGGGSEIAFRAQSASRRLVPEILGYRLGPSSVTLGILIGISIIVLSIIATGVYTFLANTYLDKEQENILQQLEEADVIEALKNGEIGYKVEGERL